MMASDAWPEDIPIWVDDVQKWMTGLTRRTTCDDVIYALLYSRGQLETDSTEHYAVFERWRAVERPLQGRTKIVKVWAAWGAEQPNVQLIVRRLDDYFMPPGASNSRTRRRHRHSKGQRAKHLANCRCSGRSQCVRCGKLRALEHLVRHMVRQERRLQELQQRVQDTERQITEYETRMHVRRVQQDGRDYVQESYLEHDSPDSSSSSSEDPLDAVLLSVGEDRLDEYLALCNKLYDVTQRLDHTQLVACSLAREIQTISSGGDTSGRLAGSSRSRRAESELEAVHVQLTRAVAASVLQQQQELELARELTFWETQLTDRTHKLTRLSQQVTAAESATDRQTASHWDTISDQHSIHPQHNDTVRQRGLTNGTSDGAHTTGDSERIAPAHNSYTPSLNCHEPRKVALVAPETQHTLPTHDLTYSVPGVKSSARTPGRPGPVTDQGAKEQSWYWRDDSGLSQSASDCSTDSGMPGLEGEELAHHSGPVSNGRSVPQNSQYYPTSKHPFRVSHAVDTELHRHPLQQTSAGVAQLSIAVPVVRDQLQQCHDVKPRPLFPDKELTDKHDSRDASNGHNSSVSSDDNTNVPVIFSKFPAVQGTSHSASFSRPDHDADRPPTYTKRDKLVTNDFLVPSLKQVTPLRAKCVRFADELTSCRWREEGDTNSDDTGLSSMHSDDVTPLETLV